MKQRIGFIGLGTMGFPMAGHLAAAGHEVKVFNRSAEKALRWVEQFPGAFASSPAEAAEGCDFVFSCVSADKDVKDVTIGESGAFERMAKGSIFVDHSTTSAELARTLAVEAVDREIGFLDAPVSGGQAGAEKGQLTVMAGGREHDFLRAQPLVQCYAKSCRLIGPSGTGQLTKMVNQICIAGIIQGLAEALHFAKRANLDTDRVIEAISQGAAQSWQMDHRADTMLAGEFEFGFAVDLMRKDLGLCLREAEQSSADLQVTRLIDEFYGDVQKLGGGRWDTSSLIVRLEGGVPKR